MDDGDELAVRRAASAPPPRRATEAEELQVADHLQAQSDRWAAERDRQAAARDREAAAKDRAEAADYLRRTYRDGLTGALQREAGRDQLANEVDRAHRNGSSLVVAFLDVVGLKKTNDRYGHAAGDTVLRLVGQALLHGLRPYDVVVRWGGDEFVCALPDTAEGQAEVRFTTVQVGLASESIGLSLGLASLAPDELLQHVVDRADQDLYARRRIGRGP